MRLADVFASRLGGHLQRREPIDLSAGNDIARCAGKRPARLGAAGVDAQSGAIGGGAHFIPPEPNTMGTLRLSLPTRSTADIDIAVNGPDGETVSTVISTRAAGVPAGIIMNCQVLP